MSELKAFNCVESDLQEFCEPRLVYLKSEVDKAIAELQSKVTLSSLADDCSNLRNKRCNYCSELRHHKYKRCLAMARWCFTKSNYHFVLARHGEDVKENNRKSILYSMWRRRWLELAKQFKEEN